MRADVSLSLSLLTSMFPFQMVPTFLIERAEELGHLSCTGCRGLGLLTVPPPGLSCARLPSAGLTSWEVEQEA